MDSEVRAETNHHRSEPAICIIRLRHRAASTITVFFDHEQYSPGSMTLRVVPILGKERLRESFYGVSPISKVSQATDS